MFGAILGIGASLIASDNASSAASSAAQGSNELAHEQAKIANDLHQYWQQQYQPLETSLIHSTAKGLKPDYAGVTGRASADVLNSFSKARAMSRRNLERMGVNPNSGAYMDQQRIMGVNQAANEAGAINRARTNERNTINDVNFSRRLALTNLGRGLPAQASQGLSSASGELARSAQMYGQAAGNTARAIGGLPWQQIGNTITGAFSPTTGMSVGNTYMPSASTPQGYWSGNSAPNLKFAHGGLPRVQHDASGMVVGGDGTQDSVPAAVVDQSGAESPIRLDEGEMVIPRSVVRAKGLEFFQKLIDKYDTDERGEPQHGHGLPAHH